MAIYKGNRGFVKVNASQSCEILNWTVYIEYDRPDMTQVASTYQQTGLGLIRGGGSFESYVSFARTSLTFDIQLKQDNGLNITGKAQLTRFENRNPADGLITYKYDFIFNGDEFTIT
jgi:hypothetical protein